MSTNKLSLMKRRTVFTGSEIFPLVADGKNWQGTPDDLAKYVAPFVPVVDEASAQAAAAAASADASQQSAADAQDKLSAAQAAAEIAQAAAEEAKLAQPPVLLGTYDELRAYSGAAAVLTVTGKGIYGPFSVDATDPSTGDNNCTVIVDSSGRRWKRQYSGLVDLHWLNGDADVNPNPRGPWVAATPYAVNDLYIDQAVTYLVLAAHTSTTIAADLAAAKVAIYQDGTFMQAGAGAALRTPQQKMMETVTPFDFVGSNSDYSVQITKAAAVHPTIKVPPGDYPILSSMNLTNVSLAFDRGARLLPAAGVSVSLGAISAGLYPIFGGDGTCTVSNLTERVYPEWWGAIGNNATADHVAVKAAIDNSAVFGNIATLTRDYGLGARLEINPAAQIESSRGSSFVPIGGQADAVVLLRGNMTGRQVLPSMGAFSGCQLEVRCSLGDVYVRQFNTGGTPIRFQAGGAGAPASVLCTIVHFDSIYRASNIPVEFAFNYATDVIQGCGVVGNFITESKNAVAFTGTAAFDDGLFCDIYALDFTEGGGAVLDNRIAGHSVPRFTLNVRSWLGGNGFVEAGNETKLVKGSWNNAEINIVNAQQFSQANLAYQLLRASRIKCRQWGSLGGAVSLVRLTDGLPAFNGGKVSDKTNFIAKITLAADLSAGATTAYYFYSIWADGAYAGWKVNTITAPSGCSLVWAQDQGDTEAYRVGVAIRNHGASAITAGSTVTFYIERA
ncbi:hypothetical protein [Burkholderia anthina]|uniref:hypothetical protein n=1 Tax=Burkholderia anthina TaxID=179879 RepID=UPI001AA06AA3|nr:hypothetical protein [Burkholderia anthina]QTD89473.1 hypothetical protein J4G50_17010 [Burkholderia anthina]